MYRLITFDLDGTFLDSGKNIPEINLKAIEEAHKKGIEIVPATGRLYGGIPDNLRTIPYIRYYILINGAKVYDALEDRIVFSAALKKETALSLMEYAETLDCIYDAYIDDKGYMNREMHDRFGEYVADSSYLKYMKSIRTPVEDLRRMIRENDCHVQKTQFFFRNMEERMRQLEAIPKLFNGIKVSSSISTNIEINSAMAGKGTALHALCCELGFSPSETIAFGDGLNDKEMLIEAGIGVAMANSEKEVLEAADITAPSNNDGGVGRVILELI